MRSGDKEPRVMATAYRARETHMLSSRMSSVHGALSASRSLRCRERKSVEREVRFVDFVHPKVGRICCGFEYSKWLSEFTAMEIRIVTPRAAEHR